MAERARERAGESAKARETRTDGTRLSSLHLSTMPLDSMHGQATYLNECFCNLRRFMAPQSHQPASDTATLPVRPDAACRSGARPLREGPSAAVATGSARCHEPAFPQSCRLSPMPRLRSEPARRRGRACRRIRAAPRRGTSGGTAGRPSIPRTRPRSRPSRPCCGCGGGSWASVHRRTWAEQ